VEFWLLLATPDFNYPQDNVFLVQFHQPQAVNHHVLHLVSTPVELLAWDVPTLLPHVTPYVLLKDS